MLEKIDKALLAARASADFEHPAKAAVAQLELLNLLIELRAEVAEFATNVNRYYNGGCGTPEELIEKINQVFK